MLPHPNKCYFHSRLYSFWLTNRKQKILNKNGVKKGKMLSSRLLIFIKVSWGRVFNLCNKSYPIITKSNRSILNKFNLFRNQSEHYISRISKVCINKTTLERLGSRFEHRKESAEITFYQSADSMLAFYCFSVFIIRQVPVDSSGRVS